MASVLITGGAGFIGAHLAAELLQSGDDVRVLDNLEPQVHGGTGRPEYLPDDVELVVGDVRDPEAVRGALQGIDRVVHLAARVGVGQSMYELAEYTGTNAHGTSVLLQALLDHPLERLVVASSMSVYGEGLYRDPAGEVTAAATRSREQLQAGRWEPCGPGGEELVPMPTPESKPPSLSSVYALNKFDQERLCLLFGEAYQVPTVALRFFNVYGPYQALSNPYTGVLAIFASRLLNDRSPLVFEDGEQRRDFVSVHDIARACSLALTRDRAAGHVINVGSGRSITVNKIATRLSRILGKEHIVPEVTGKYRVGDIRHCFADIGLARELLGFEPQTELDDGLVELAGWLEGQVAVDSVDTAAKELASRGLTV
ncbi:MAG: NAD-dependent epimerase/dehydratase family protein [Streptomyces sp.]|uniref:NAD-dependent epimerase/dehydratase family protein n=1 Tax=Streptomyces sp. TaxID=1931 RepID=UPI0025FA6F60|nr:NAD-dependent epimerase/dehydratase family protein [Streptomyces sp.]MBW8801457.1 NAD-dependent epimerase/dehydratase family protein [Streptomyces sp.]